MIWFSSRDFNYSQTLATNMDEAWVEIDALRSIYEDEIQVESRPDGLIVVEKRVRPNDEGGVSSASVVVQFTLAEGYPANPPLVVLSNPRGISDAAHSTMEREVAERLGQNDGMPVIFEILQLCADQLLTHQHSDSLLCPICLCHLSSSAVSSTPCDHYTHTECLDQHRLHTRRQLGEKLTNTPTHMQAQVDRSLLCPVCREIMEDDVDPIYPPPPPKKGKAGRRSREPTSQSSPTAKPAQHEKFDFDWTCWRIQQASLRSLFEKQQRQGGIIDLEEERKKNLITEHTVVVLPTVSARSAEDIDAGTTVEGRCPPGFETKAPAPQADTASPTRGRDNRGPRNRGVRVPYHGGAGGRTHVRYGGTSNGTTKPSSNVAPSHVTSHEPRAVPDVRNRPAQKDPQCSDRKPDYPTNNATISNPSEAAKKPPRNRNRNRNKANGAAGAPTQATPAI